MLLALYPFLAQMKTCLCLEFAAMHRAVWRRQKVVILFSGRYNEENQDHMEETMSQFLNAFAEFMNGRRHQMHRIAEYCEGGEIEKLQLSPATPCQNIYSIAKAFTVAAVGMLVDRGLLSNDDKVVDVLGDLCPASFNPLWKETTIHMLLRHQVGLPGGFMDIDCNDANAFGDDYLSYVMNHPLRDDHGTV